MQRLIVTAIVALTVMSVQFVGAGRASAQSAATTIVVTETHIATIKAALQLTAEQEKYWPSVAATLRHIGHLPADAGGGLMEQVRYGAVVAADVDRLRRLAAVAAPLIRTLSPDQKRNAAMAARALGFGSIVAAF